MEMRYSINNLSKRQLLVMRKALDIYTRLGLLQFESAILDEMKVSESFCESYLDNYREIEHLLLQLKRLMVTKLPPYNKDGQVQPGWSLSVINPIVPGTCKVSYEIYSDIGDFIASLDNAHQRGKLKLTKEPDALFAIHKIEDAERYEDL